MNARRPDLARLTPPEKDALIRDLWRQVAAGQSEARLLRRRLGMAEGTVKSHVRQIMRKLGATNRTQAAICGLSSELARSSDPRPGRGGRSGSNPFLRVLSSEGAELSE